MSKIKSSLFSTIVVALLTLTACSQHKEFKATALDEAKALYQEQTVNQANAVVPIKILHTINGKAVIGHELEIELEVLALTDLKSLQIILTPMEGYELAKRWWIFEQPFLEKSYKNIRKNQSVKYSFVVIPTKNIDSGLDVYVVAETDKGKMVRSKRIPISTELMLPTTARQ